MIVLGLLSFRDGLFAQSKTPDWNKTFGVAVTQKETTCLRVNSKAPVPKLVLILYPERRGLAMARVEREVESCPDEVPGRDLKYFELQTQIKDEAVGIAILPETSRGAGMTTDIDDNGKRESYRICTSNEGLHLTVWADAPLKSRRLWHYYYFLGYDVEPSCKSKDYE